MAAIVVSSTEVYCQRLETFSPRELVRLGTDGTGLAPNDTETALGLTAGKIADQALELGTKGYITLRVQGTTDTNTADSVAIDLGTAGVTFADGTFRRLEAIAKVADDDGMGMLINRAVVDGGSTVILSDTDLDSALDDGLSGAPTPAFALNAGSTAVEYNAVGPSAVDIRWDIEVRVYPASALAYFSG